MSYEERARQAKVACIVASLPTTGNRRLVVRMAAWLSTLSQADRTRLASAAGQRAPSEETWADVVSAVRSRPTISQIGVRP